MCTVQNTAGGIAWSKDNSTIFYVTKDEVLRPDKVRSQAPPASVSVQILSAESQLKSSEY